MSSTLVLIDGHALAYRAFYALPRDRFATRNGEPTYATYGFTSVLLNILRDVRPDALAVCFDAGRTFRDDRFPDYKGTRAKLADEAADDLKVQMDRIAQLLHAFHIPVYSLEGYEADDLLGTLARQAAERGVDTLIVTGDRDLLQLVSPHVRVYLSGKRLSDGKIYDQAQVREEYGLEPLQIIDLKGLIGDKSDNIPGVRGIGDKTATELLHKYGTLDNVYAHLDELRESRRKLLENGRDNAVLSRDLATIRLDAPIQFDLESCRTSNFDYDRLTELFRELEFRTLHDRLREVQGVMQGGRHAEDRSEDGQQPAETTAAPAASPLPAQQLNLFEPGAPVIEAPRRLTATYVIADEAGLAALTKRLEQAQTISFDTETTSTDELQARLVGIALSIRPGEGYYIPIGHDPAVAGIPQQLSMDQVVHALQPVMQDANKPKIAHNAKYDYTVLACHGLTVRPIVFDTMLAEYLCNPGGGNLGLKNLAWIRLNIEMTPIEALIGKGKKQISMDQVPISLASAYSAADVDMTLRLMPVLQRELEEKRQVALFRDVEMPLVPILSEIEQAGVRLDVPYLEEMSVELGQKLNTLQYEIFQEIGYAFNLNSTQQLSEALFGKLALPTSGMSKTQSGHYSTSADVLESLRSHHPVIERILEYRQLSKLKSTYVDALPAMVDPRDGRLHTDYNQTGAVTGRISSQNPNLQNIPIRTDIGRRVRRAFIAADGCKLISADYSQIELRILAHITGEATLVEAFRQHEDVHASTAAAIMNVPIDRVTKEMRRVAKTVNYAVLYGQSAYGLAQTAGIPHNEANEFITAYYARLPKVREYLESTKRTAAEKGYVETLLGRRRYFPTLQGQARGQAIARAAAEREAINAPIQGTAADINKIAMIKLHQALAERRSPARIILHVHDELVVEAPNHTGFETARLMREVMTQAFPLQVELEVETKIGDNWEEMAVIEAQ